MAWEPKSITASAGQRLALPASISSSKEQPDMISVPVDRLFRDEIDRYPALGAEQKAGAISIHANSSALWPLLDAVAAQIEQLKLPQDVLEVVADDLLRVLPREIAISDDCAAVAAGEIGIRLRWADGTAERCAAAFAAFERDGIAGWRHVIEASFVSVVGESQISTKEASSL